MVANLASIIAQVHNPKQIEKLRGEGIVEKKIDDNTYVLRFSSGKIKVTLTSGSLSPQTAVRIKNQGGQAIVIPVPPQKNTSDQIAFSPQKIKNSNAYLFPKLLSIIVNTPSGSNANHKLSNQQYEMVLKRLATEIQNNPQFFRSNKELQVLGEKIIAAISRFESAPNQHLSSDFGALIRAVELKLIELSSDQQKSIVLSHPVEPGFIFFPSGKEAIAWLEQMQPSLDKSTLANLSLSKAEPVIIQTITSTDGSTIAMIANKDDGIVLVDSYIHNEAKSPLWETIRTNLFLSLLTSKGSITNHSLDAIDKILQSLTSNPDNQNTVSTKGFNHFVQQWIALMLDHPTALQTISKQFPIDAAKDFASQFEQLFTKLFPNTPAQSDSLKEVLTHTIQHQDMPKADIIVNAFNKMGYNLEHSLLQSESDEVPQGKGFYNSIKTQLYSLLLPQVQNNDTITSPPPVKDVKEHTNISLPIKTIDKLLQSLIFLHKGALVEMPMSNDRELQEPPKPSIETIRIIKSLADEIINQLTEGNQRLAEMLNIEIAKQASQESQVNMPNTISFQPLVVKSDSVDQLLFFIMQSTRDLEQTLEAVKTSTNPTSSSDFKHWQQLVDTSLRILSQTKEFLAQFQQKTPAPTEQLSEIISYNNKSSKNILPVLYVPVKELQNLTLELRHSLSHLYNESEAITSSTHIANSSTGSHEQLPKQIMQLIQSFASILDQSRQDITQQLENMSETNRNNQVELEKLASMVNRVFKDVAQSMQNDLSNSPLSQGLGETSYTTANASAQTQEYMPPVNKNEIEKLLLHMLTILRKNYQEIQHYGNVFQNQAPLESHQQIEKFNHQSNELMKRLMDILKSLLERVQDQPSQIFTPKQGGKSLLNEIIDNAIRKYFKPLDSISQNLSSPFPSQATEKLTHTLHQLMDDLYKTVINERNLLNNEITSLTQKVLDTLKNGNNVNQKLVTSHLQSITDLTSSLTSKLMSSLGQQNLSIENGLRNILENFTSHAKQWEESWTRMQSFLAQKSIASFSELKDSLIQSIQKQISIPKDSRQEFNTLTSQTIDSSMAKTLTELKHHIAQMPHVFQPTELAALKSFSPQWQSILQSMMSSVQNYETDIGRIIANVEEKIIQTLKVFQKGEINQEAISKTTQSLTNNLSQNMNRLIDSLIKDLVAQLEKFTKDIEKHPENIFRQASNLMARMKEEVNQLIRSLNQQVDSFSSQTEKNLSTTLPENIRQQAETMLSRFESLQILAKPLPTAEGQQQVLSLPIKFGEEWTDVKVILIKRQKKKNKRIDQKNFSVQMHVAPTHCGAINVIMDYNLKYKLNVKIEFEKNNSRVWFNKHKEQLITALKNNGIPSVALSLESHLSRPQDKKANPIPVLTKKGGKKTRIDINV